MRFLDWLVDLRGRPWTGYIVALAGAAVGVGLRFALAGALEGAPFVTFFPGILLASLAGGIGAGVAAGALSALLAMPGLIETPWAAWPAEWVAILTFGFIAAILIALADLAARAIGRLTSLTTQLQELNKTLEDRVTQRTHDLTVLTAQLREEIKTKETAEASFVQAQKMEAIGQLTGGIAHDFNNMLSIILGSLDVTRRRLMKGDTDIVRYIDNAIDGAQRAATLTRQLLAFSRKQTLDPAVTDANALVSNMAELLRRTLSEQISLECVLAGGLWRIRVDPGLLENALLNLAVNARDAMPSGGRLTIETQNTHLDEAYADAHNVDAGQYVLVAVTDTGIGMPKDVIDHAFDPFFTTKATGQGTGLGLSQVYGFVKQSMGHVKIYSEVMRGTTIKIYLPRYRGSDLERITDRKPSQEPAVPMGSPEETILVVDDDEAVRNIHVGLLRELNYTVCHATNGQEAMRSFKELQGVDLLFTDVVMPGMSGRQLADEARLLMPGLKVLYTTGYTANAVIHNGIVDHGVELLPKPFSYDQLARRVRAVLDRDQPSG